MFPWPYPRSSSMTWIGTHLWFWRPVGVSHANLHMDMFFLWSVLKCQMLHNKSRKNHDSATMSHISNKTGVQAQTEAPTPKISQPAGRPLIRHQGLAAERFDQYLPTPTPNQLRINPSQSIAQNVTLGQWRCGRQLAQEKTTTEALKMPRVCLCVLSCVCVCVLLSFPYSLGRIMDKVGVCPHLDVLMLVLKLRTLCLTAVARSETLGMPNIDFFFKHRNPKHAGICSHLHATVLSQEKDADAFHIWTVRRSRGMFFQTDIGAKLYLSRTTANFQIH